MTLLDALASQPAVFAGVAGVLAVVVGTMVMLCLVFFLVPVNTAINEEEGR